MTDLDLLRQHMQLLRQRCLKGAHMLALSGDSSHFTSIVIESTKADLIDRLLKDMKELEVNPGEFIKRNLQHDD